MWSFLHRESKRERASRRSQGWRKANLAVMETMEGRVLMSTTVATDGGTQRGIEAVLSNGNVVIAGAQAGYPSEVNLAESNGTTNSFATSSISSPVGWTIIDPRLIAMKQAPDGNIWLLVTDWNVANHQGFALVELDSSLSPINNTSWDYPVVTTPTAVETEWANDMTFIPVGSSYDILVAGGLGPVTGSSYEDYSLGWYTNNGIIAAVKPTGGLDTSWNSTGYRTYSAGSSGGILGQIAYNSSVDSNHMYATEIINGSSSYSNTFQIVQLNVSDGSTTGTTISASTLGFSSPSLPTPFGIGIYSLSGATAGLVVGAYNISNGASKVDWVQFGTSTSILGSFTPPVGDSLLYSSTYGLPPTLAVISTGTNAGYTAIGGFANSYDGAATSMGSRIASNGLTNTQVLLIDGTTPQLAVTSYTSGGLLQLNLH